MSTIMSLKFVLMLQKYIDFWLEPAELDEKIISCTGNSLKGQIPLQLAELSGKPSLSISAQETLDDSPETETRKSTAAGASFATRMFTPRLSYFGYFQLCVVT